MSGALFPPGTAAAVGRRLTPEPERALPTDPVRWVREDLDEFSWSIQRNVMRSVVENRDTAVQSCHGIGKALALDTPLPTPTGWTTMADVRAGDALLDERGRPCRVLEARQWLQDRPCYRVRFDDGTAVVADAEHEWSVTRFRSRATRRARVGAGVVDWRDEHAALAQTVTTRGLRAALRTSWGQRDAAVPLAAALDLPERALPVDPYVLGVYLADGTRADGGITVAVSEAWWIEPRLGGHRVISSLRGSSFIVRVPGLKVKLRDIGALNPKRIPASYLRASYEQRLAVLRGVMDGDGFARGGGAAGIDLTHEALAMDVLELMRSLGLRPTVRTAPAVLDGRRVGTRWRISVTQTVPVFSLPTKLRDAAPSQACRYTQRMIVGVDPVAPRPTKCVMVDSPSHLFLCGEGMVPTHNSWLASRVAAWWIAGHPRGEAMVVTTAPSGHQVRTILWGELARAHRRGGLAGRITAGQVPEWQIDGELVAFGRKPQDYVSHEQARTMFQGIHARYLLVVLDEAGGVPEWLWDATTSLVTNESARRLAIGNPDDPTTRFERVCRPGSGWNVMQVGYMDTPNFTGERIPEHLRESLIGPTYVETARREWGESSALYTSKVLGKFPDVSDDVVITPRMIREAHMRDLSHLQVGCRGRFGMDVAERGADETCVYRNQDGFIRLAEYRDHATGQTLPAAWRGVDLPVAVPRVRALLDEPRFRNVAISVDVVGLGMGIFTPLSLGGYNVERFSGGEAAMDPSRFVNRRAEAWWAFREGLEAGLIDLDPDDEVLAAQLQSPKWKLDASQRRIRLESKEDMAKRGVPSPDRGDAAVMSFYAGYSRVDDAAAIIEGTERSSIAGDLLTAKW